MLATVSPHDISVCSLLDGPLHQSVCGNERRDGVENLVPRSAHDVPEALGDEGCHGSLSVGAEGVGHDALAGSAASLVGVTPGANVPSVCSMSACVSLVMPAQRGGVSGEGAGAGRRLGAVGSWRSGDVRGLVSCVGIGAAASHCEDVSGWMGGAMGECVEPAMSVRSLQRWTLSSVITCQDR
jgi:hypothetical protein